MPPTLVSPRVTTTARELNELYFANGWTDGLPVVPPTPDVVAEFVEFEGCRPTTSSRPSPTGTGA